VHDPGMLGSVDALGRCRLPLIASFNEGILLFVCQMHIDTDPKSVAWIKFLGGDVELEAP
jgi:hypothetical protein